MGDVLATLRSPPRLVSVILSAALCFALTCWAWWQIGSPGVGDPVLIARTLYALVYVLFAWGAASAMTLGIYLAICTGDFKDLLIASLLASLPAVWLVPAILLLSTHRPIAVAGGLLLIANSARLLFSHRVPHRYATTRTRPSRQVPGSLFATAGPQPGLFSADSFPALFGAFAFQIGIYAACADSVFLAAALCAGGAVGWTRSSISRGACNPRQAGTFQHSQIGVLLVVLLAVTLSISQMGITAPDAGAGANTQADAPGIFETTRRLLARLAHPAGPAPPAAASSATPVFSAQEQPAPVGKDGAPGVILRPKTTPRRRPVIVPPVAASTSAFSRSEPLRIPFTGEYHLFLASSGRLPPNSVVQTGTPRDALYGTTNGGQMQMEAYQPFDPPIDFTHCGTLQLTLSVGDALPAGVGLQLITANRLEDLGTEFYGLESKSEQTLDFQVPAHPIQAIAVRVLFHSLQPTHSTKAAIRQFTLFPRPY